MVEADPNLITCNCGAVIQFEEAKVDYNIKMDRELVSKETAEHMAKYRVRCAKCTKNFCASCKQEPYHLGKSCEEAENFKDALKCRFCWEQLTEPSPSDKPAFKDVCRTKNCIELMKASCSKLHECGHPCKGFANETNCLPCLEVECIKNHNVM